MTAEFTHPLSQVFPKEYVSRIGCKATVLGVTPNGRLVGFFTFSDGEISSADWDETGRFSKHDEEPSCNDIFDFDSAPEQTIKEYEMLHDDSLPF